jgi:hypothetical protein
VSRWISNAKNRLLNLQRQDTREATVGDVAYHDTFRASNEQHHYSKHEPPNIRKTSLPTLRLGPATALLSLKKIKSQERATFDGRVQEEGGEEAESSLSGVSIDPTSAFRGCFDFERIWHAW